MQVDSRWRGKCALVTGASSGIGKAIAASLAEAGLKVVVAARRKERLDALASEIGESAFAVQVDLRDDSSIEELFKSIRDRFGGVDILINNAGLGHSASLLDGDTEKWRETLEVNVLGLCVATREATRDMRRRGVEGFVIHISSMSAHRVAGAAVYSASKFAVRALTEGLRREIAELELPIHVTSISPGFVETEFAEHFHQSAEQARETYSRYPVLLPSDIAEAIGFLLRQPERVQYHDLLLRPHKQPN